MSRGMMNGCKRSRGLADNWDAKFGVTDETVIPESHSLPATKTRTVRVGQGDFRPRMSLNIPSQNPSQRGLGDAVESALTLVGITKDRVEKFLGRPCDCRERKEKLNRLSAWAKRIVSGETEKAEDYLNEIIGSR